MNSVGGGTDSSALAWAEGTLAAAEAYSQAEADAAAEARDAAERNGDGVEPPSAHQRALDAFYEHDPNRPASTLPPTSGGPDASGGTSGGGDGRTSVQLTPEEAKAFSDAGMKVTSDGNGGYYLETSTIETVSVTSKAEPPPVNAIPAPSTNTTPVSEPPPPAAPPQETKPAEETKPTEETKKPDAPEKAKTKHPVKDLDKLDGLDPDFKKKAEQFIEKMQEKGWKMRVVWGKRTKEENDALVERGTASKTSKHLDGKGVDLINREDPYPTDKDNAYYKDMEAVAKEVGVTWGGDFSTRWDPTHFEAK